MLLNIFKNSLILIRLMLRINMKILKCLDGMSVISVELF